MEATGVAAEWKSTMKATGKKCVEMTGVKRTLRCSAERLAAAPLPLSLDNILEREVTWMESKLTVLEMRALFQNAHLRNSSNHVMMLL